ncbi:MAG: hypothetical protein JST75_09475 [Bacteroidetes bacterium]|nr:hypothetical protein [Bacteroidota bacterium]
MKLLIKTIIISLFFFGCKKETNKVTSSDYESSIFIEKVKPCLKNLLNDADYASLDFSKQVLTDNKVEKYLQLGFKFKNASEDFLILKTDSFGNCIDGRIVHLEKDKQNFSQFNGKISVQNFHHEATLSSNISEGYIVALHPRRFSEVSSNSVDVPNLLPTYVQTLPEVIVVGYTYPTGSVSTFTDFMSFQAVFNNGTGSTPAAGGVSGIYGPVGGGSGSAGSTLPKILNIKYETSISKPGINVASYMDCFSTLADAGAQCTLSIFTDLPVDNNPDIFFNWYAGATGHVFLQLTKSNADRFVTQVIGFQPQKPMQAMFGAGSVASKIVDNGSHKYNASLTMNITPAQLASVISEIEFLAGTMQYDIAKYNCVDFALQVVNIIRGVNPLIIPRYQIPGQDDITKSNTPQGLYKLLQQKKAVGDGDAKNIVVGVGTNAPTSKGPCN